MARADSDDALDKWWKTLLGGIFFIALGIGLYMFFDAKERSGEGFRMNAIVLLVYEILGKNGVLIVCLAIGAVAVALSISERRKQVAPPPPPAVQPPHVQPQYGQPQAAPPRFAPTQYAPQQDGPPAPAAPAPLPLDSAAPPPPAAGPVA